MVLLYVYVHLSAPFPIGLPWECEEEVWVVERWLGFLQRWDWWPLSACSLPFPSSFLLLSRLMPKGLTARPRSPKARLPTAGVDENTAAYYNIGAPVAATDDDTDRLTFSIKNARTSPFTIDRSNGQLQVGQPLGPRGR